MKLVTLAIIISMISLGVLGLCLTVGNMRRENNYISFEDAIACSRKERTKPARWDDYFEGMYPMELGETREYSFTVYRKDNITGYFLYRLSNGTLFEAEYPSGKIGKALYMIIAPGDKEEYYVWEIIDLSEHIPYVRLGKQIWIDARNGEILFELPAGERGPPPPENKT